PRDIVARATWPARLVEDGAWALSFDRPRHRCPADGDTGHSGCIVVRCPSHAAAGRRSPLPRVPHPPPLLAGRSFGTRWLLAGCGDADESAAARFSRTERSRPLRASDAA